ncbi:hypothetical protein X762_29580 [Mesorhizobium sp. LSHC426A00]|uniref:hypothetical protein n=1 Tax=Mesorhizobium sp. LSHC426A00 TaxID=1287298 RepID=UPI0003CF6D66|nr:hypothetical protein [Mesorhizobium sp. LSHC416B00]ESX42586.1 hypothetical protein X762_29580 [Mesorhizobium sp. LSHC426A00]
MTLQMESPASSIQVEDWLRGEPLTNFQPGKVYIVDFGNLVRTMSGDDVPSGAAPGEIQGQRA